VILDTATLAPVFREPTIERVGITPDGRRLLGYASPYRERMYVEPAPAGWRETYPVTGHGLAVIDLQSLDVVYRLLPGEPILGAVVMSMDGRYAYATTYAPGALADDLRACGVDCYRLHVIDIARGEDIAQRVLGQQQQLIGAAWP